MNALAKAVNEEMRLIRRQWNTGGSDLHPPKKPPLSAFQAARVKVRKSVEDEYTSVSDDALDHINWCRSRGMTPQDVANSISSGRKLVAHTWLMAAFLVEQEAWQMRMKK